MPERPHAVRIGGVDPNGPLPVVGDRGAQVLRIGKTRLRECPYVSRVEAGGPLQPESVDEVRPDNSSRYTLGRANGTCRSAPTTNLSESQTCATN